ncbi:MAG: PHP domain-containing protein [Sphingomonadaceae bacterium]
MPERRSKVDLHLHTTASDGALTPAELVREASAHGLECIAVTDHDSTEGIEEALAEGERLGVQVIPGIEMSTDIPRAEVHILGYFIDYKNQEFQSILRQLRDGRRDRAEKMVAKLAQMGLDVPWERVLEVAGQGSVGRPHIAQVMVEKGYVSSMVEAFTDYIGRNAPAYVERYKLTPAEAVALVRRMAGLPVLAHPGEVVTLDSLLPQLIAAGLVGMECYYGDYSPETVEGLLALADEHNLIPTGGTDFHRADSTGHGPSFPGETWVPWESVRRLKALAAHLRSGR